MLQIVYSNPTKRSSPHQFHILKTSMLGYEEADVAYIVTHEDEPIFSSESQQLLYLHRRH